MSVLGWEAKPALQRSCDPGWKSWQGRSGFGKNPERCGKRPSLLPLAAGMSILNEVGTVLIDGIIS